MLDIRAAGVAVAVGERGKDLLKREIIGLELQRIDLHLILLGRAAKADHVHHARDGAQLAFDYPVLQRPQFLAGIALGRLERVAIDFADGRRVGGEAGLGARRQSHHGEVLVHLVAHIVRVSTVLEYQRDLRKAEQADGTERDQLGDAVHLVLDGDCDQPLDFLGGVSGEQGDDLD